MNNTNVRYKMVIRVLKVSRTFICKDIVFLHDIVWRLICFLRINPFGPLLCLFSLNSLALWVKLYLFLLNKL
jgi:hypothetical protein